MKVQRKAWLWAGAFAVFLFGLSIFVHHLRYAADVAYAANDERNTSSVMAPLGMSNASIDSSKMKDVSAQENGPVTVTTKGKKTPTKRVLEDGQNTSDHVTVGDHRVNVAAPGEWGTGQTLPFPFDEGQTKHLQDIGVEATYAINLTIPGQTLAASETSWSFTRGEKVTISLSWIPRDAKLYVGLIDSEGNFYYVPFTGGADQETFTIQVADRYSIAIYNTDTHEVTVQGYVTL
ncbi:hypothetical protein [Hydrogenibacillus schlegelii]|uniref:hypothetical protein n=1 Tax=Hydrogenibacillus schlegelii TaxID=1484 RepID=UPI0023536094|nr:hypothetical protein [Hydrogenibacillus schlegelii]